MRNVPRRVLVPAILLLPLLASCGEPVAQAPQPPKHELARAEKIAEFKSQRGLEPRATTQGTSVNDRLAAELARVRAALSQYQSEFKNVPWAPGQADSDQWAPLGIAAFPVNPLSPAHVAARITEINRPGATGAVANPNEIGWVWNSADARLFAAGSDE